jgi:serine/threonine protein kinase/WD40 repeat protein
MGDTSEADHERLQAADKKADSSADAETLAPSAAPPPSGNGDTIGAQSAKAHVGTRVRYFGDYELLEEIARGGMGVVYKARQLSLNRTVALKMILAGQLAGEADVKRFYREAEAAANLDHPGIVPIFEIGQHDGQHYFSMGFVEGTSLSTKLAVGPLPPRDAAALLKQIAEAVQYAHEHGVIHRDLKPGNVLLDKQGRPRVTDFGLAKRVQSASDLTGTGQILGTPSYMPPEQAAGRLDEVRETADVYALGAILYAMLTGRPPFQADNPIDTVMQVLQREPVAPRQLNPKVPIDLETICLKCLEKTTRRRYDSADLLVAELNRFVERRPILARPVSRTQRGWRWCKRNPVVSALVASLLVAIVVGFSGITLFWVRAERETDLTQRHLYAAHMNLSNLDWERGDAALVQQRLALHRPNSGNQDLRSFEWYYLWRLCHRGYREQTFAGEDLQGWRETQLSEDGTTVCVALNGQEIDESNPGQIIVWDVATQAIRTRISRRDVDLQQFFVSPGGKTLAWLSRQQTFLYDTVTGKEKAAIPLKAWVGRAQISDDGWLVASQGGVSSPEEVRAWNKNASPTEGVLFEGSLRQNDLYGFAMSRNGTRVAANLMDGAAVWNIPSGQQIQLLNNSSFLTFSPDGRFWAVFDGNEKTVSVRDVITSEQLLEISAATGEQLLYETKFAFSPDSTTLACNVSAAIRLWDLRSKEELAPLNVVDADDEYGFPLIPIFSPDGTKLALSTASTTRVWDVHSRKQVRLIKAGRPPVSASPAVPKQTPCTFSPDSATMVSATTQSGDERVVVRMWDVSHTPEPEIVETRFSPRHWKYVPETYPFALLPDGSQLVIAAPEGIELVDIQTGKRRSLLVNNGMFNLPPYFAHLAVSPNSKRLAARVNYTRAGQSQYVKSVIVWDLATAKFETEFEVDEHVGALFFIDDKSLAIFDVSESNIHDLITGEVRRSSAAGNWLRSGDNSRWVSDVGIATIIWNGREDKEIASLRGTWGFLKLHALSFNGLLLAASYGDNSIRVWELDRLKVRPDSKTLEQGLCATFRGHSAEVNGCAFLPDGKTMVSAANDGLIKVWDLQTGEERITLQGPGGPIVQMAVSRDGKVIAVGNEQGTIKLLRAATEEEVVAHDSGD